MTNILDGYFSDQFQRENDDKNKIVIITYSYQFFLYLLVATGLVSMMNDITTH
jgi:hypothetical protein